MRRSKRLNGAIAKAFTLTAYMLLATFAGTGEVRAESNYIEDTLCYRCHKEQRQSYQSSAHSRAFATNPELGCQTCHGPGAAHQEISDQENPPGGWRIESFKKNLDRKEDKNKPCLDCHENKAHLNWRGNQHDLSGVACTDCHKLHVENDTVRPGVCYSCHPKQRAQNQHTRNPMFPKRDGARECMQCHNPHGGKGPSLLAAATVNDTCYNCHSEKRGPFLWEHAPVRENCANCHDPHGTANANLLTMRPPYLCQTCHSSATHPSHLYSANKLHNPNAFAQSPLVAKACLNCHSMIHGSNHPSGGKFQR